MMAIEDNLKVRGVIKTNEPMSKHTSWRVGGPAQVFFKPADLNDLIVFLQQQDAETEILYLGLGSNLLVRDGGINGVVIAMQGINQTLTQSDKTRVRVDAGVSCAKTARFCLTHNLPQAAFLAGIPGTMGGALAMNAGAFGGETWPYVVEVETLDRQGKLTRRQKDEFEVSYRHVKGPWAREQQEWFVSALFDFSHNQGQGPDKDKDKDSISAAEQEQNIKALLAKRNQSQPIGLPSCGSVFTNPDNDFAARLIEAAGLKGHCIGKACVSEKHANFIINTGGAQASEIESLIAHIQKSVLEKHKIRLRPEVRIVGVVA